MELPAPNVLDEALAALHDQVSAPNQSFVAAARAALDPPRTPGLAGPRTPDAPPTPAAVAARIDHTQLTPTATDAAIQQCCEEALQYQFGAVCIPPAYVPLATQHLRDSDVRVCTVIGFPLGANRPVVKATEAGQALTDGAHELDMVMNLGAFKSGRYTDVHDDIAAVVDAAADADREVLVKVILETPLLSDAETAVAAQIAKAAGADFVKTATGFSGGGATFSAVALMRQVVGDALGVKASGGVGSLDKARAMLAHGATRIGASGSVGIMEGAAASDASY
ncbi:deoxyribose-phosphate aldolase [Salisaeta longa]|uniref:deoxyribose-phosphate aldolase n=1 Tax=Salisaeta longa TaxID=503170 RepID=UPI0003B44AD9|nr:deoxyribose-phosphate aldolase [Salisaeta longa]